MWRAEVPSTSPRVIKRYSNRKLYDTKRSCYVTLNQVADMIRAGDDVQVIENATKEDKTEVTLALIISEELRERPSIFSVAALKALLEGSCPSRDTAPPASGEFVSARALEDWQASIETMLGQVPASGDLESLKLEVQDLAGRLADLERGFRAGQ
jgi:polyhydroxyalkanoate synthesis repressor PhaR